MRRSYVRRGCGGAGVSSACTAGASFSSSCTRPVNPLARHQRGGLTADPGHPAGGHGHAGHLGHQPGRTLHRDVVRAGEVRGLRVRLRPGAGPRPHVRGQLALADRLAPRALLGLRHVLRHHRRRRGLDIGDLVAALRDDRRIRKAGAALPARRRREPQPVFRVTGKLHRGSRLARLLARPPLPQLPQRPVPRLLLIRAVRGRRLR